MTKIKLVLAAAMFAALPINALLACECGGKEKCTNCCGEGKCKECTKDCCKPKQETKRS
jgi:hypothetical protein